MFFTRNLKYFISAFVIILLIELLMDSNQDVLQLSWSIAWKLLVFVVVKYAFFKMKKRNEKEIGIRNG
jgi:L-asparagine transporter-like permease